MAIPELLVGSILQSAGNNVQVAELVGGTSLNQIGADLSSTSFEANDANRKAVTNFVVEYRGDLYCNYLTNSAAGVWALHRWNGTSWSNFDNYELTGQFPGGAGVYTESLGTWVVNTGSVQRIFSLAYNSTNGVLRMLYSDDGTSWTFSADIGVGSGTPLDTGKSILFNNKLYIAFADSLNSVSVVEVDPIAIAASIVKTGLVASTQPNSTHAGLTVYDDRLFLCVEASAANLSLYEFTGGGWSFNVNITTSMSFNTGNPEQGACAMFTDPTTGDLIVFFNGTNSGFQRGSFAVRLTPSGSTFTPTDITNTVVPAGLRPGVRGTAAVHIEDRWFVFVSTDTPGSTEVYLFVAQGPAPGSGYTIYQWVDVSTEVSLVGAGPSTIYAIPETPFGGGDRIYRNTGNQCAIESAQAVLGGYEISYRVYGTQSGQSVTLWYSQGQEAPDQQGSISAQTGGSGITGGNTVTGITGDDGTTLFTLVWDIAADGVPSGDACHILLDIG